jgi:hypothetical protein
LEIGALERWRVRESIREEFLEVPGGLFTENIDDDSERVRAIRCLGAANLWARVEEASEADRGSESLYFALWRQGFHDRLEHWSHCGEAFPLCAVVEIAQHAKNGTEEGDNRRHRGGPAAYRLPEHDPKVVTVLPACRRLLLSVAAMAVSSVESAALTTASAMSSF